MILKVGDKSEYVGQLQTDLVKLGYEVGDVDGDFGAKTRAAVLAFQMDYSDVDDDGIAGPQTFDKIAAILRGIPAAISSVVEIESVTWSAIEGLISLLEKTPVMYGPGRGLFDEGKFVITHGPGALKSKSWKNFLGHSYPSFHCTSWTNFFLGWLLRRNAEYTHAGNIPDLFDLLRASSAKHSSPGVGTWRGYGEDCELIMPDGSTARRTGVTNVVDAIELYNRRGELPRVIVCGQSSRSGTSWKWWHHTVVFIMREGRMYRIAADGYRDAARGYSATPMRMVEITSSNVGALSGAIYRAYGVRSTPDGHYGDQGRKIAEVTVEQ